MVQIQPVTTNIASAQYFFFIFIYGVLQGDTFLLGYFYIFKLIFIRFIIL